MLSTNVHYLTYPYNSPVSQTLSSHFTDELTEVQRVHVNHVGSVSELVVSIRFGIP